MKSPLFYKALCLSLVLVLSASAFCSCVGKQPEANAYESTVPASFSETAGVERTMPEPPYNPTEITQQDSTGYTICVDPGHGFLDGGCGDGCYSDGTLERDITLDVATLLTKRLELLGYKVIQTHNGKDLPSQDTNKNRVFSATERVVYANSLDIDYLISIHVNSLDGDTSVKGMHIYYKQSDIKVNDWSRTLSESIADALAEEIGPEAYPRIKDGSDPNTTFAITKDVTAASSLLEIGFITNETDAANMVDPLWQEVVANAIADGIDNFFKGLNTKA